MIKLDIISDPICPWCAIGKARLDRAMEARPDHAFEIEWHPFQLNPEMPPEGMDRREYLEAKFGGREQAVQFYAQIEKAAQDAGLDVNFEKIARTPSTLDAHRLIHWAGIEGVQSLVVAALFRAYFRDGLDISDHAVLVEIAAKQGMDKDVFATLLSKDVDKDGIRKRDAFAREKGVSGVPCFIVDNHYVVQGAQPPEMWERVIDEISQKTAERSA